ncbi:MAG: endonuclease/exonuclease/phosphatase family protein [Verrucomicrobia bacterium]|nr:MAG: endonuclease/exonuclease/phosphatase family protein [Verrucomicrobiota bacterium]
MHALNHLKANNQFWFAIGFAIISFGLCGCDSAQSNDEPRPTQQTNEPLPLRLMTINVRYEHDEDAQQNAWSKRVIGMVHMIQRERPDVFAVQEAMHGQVADLWASLPAYQFIGTGRDDGHFGGEYTGIFFLKSRLIEDSNSSQTRWLSDQPTQAGSKHWGNQFPRVVCQTRLWDRATGRAFHVFATHWDHRHQASRERSALLLGKWIASRQPADEPVVLLGDFNAVESNPALGYLLGKSVRLDGDVQRWSSTMIDTYQTMHPKQKDRTTLHFWSFSQGGRLKVDHILISQDGTVKDAAILSEKINRVSDHFAVSADVVFPAATDR